jgi:hypothetical protein
MYFDWDDVIVQYVATCIECVPVCMLWLCWLWPGSCHPCFELWGVFRVGFFFVWIFIYLGLFERIKVDSTLWCFWTFRSSTDGPSVLYPGFCIDPIIIYFLCIQLALICIFTNDVYTFLGWAHFFFLYSQLNHHNRFPPPHHAIDTAWANLCCSKIK